ncbi:hypothetical protein L1049_027853 [Liquidambar formosana]|uniref:Uncharacterized protein n=1 Tax=Liquidambar formosana TaxID=63359 RepID=A0AAP0WVU7_LIQFO
MKDSLTMKELSDENYESQDTNEHSFHNRASNDSSPQQDMDKSTKYDAKEPYDYKSEENSGSISKIEAELEAELERLELSMSSSRLKREYPILLRLTQTSKQNSFRES